MRGQTAIFECACPEHARNSKKSRELLEAGVMQLFEKEFAQPDECTLLNIGPGGCFQELVLHAKAALLNKKINWILVDSLLFKKNSTFAFVEFERLVHQVSPGASQNWKLVPGTIILQSYTSRVIIQRF